ncbi:hypothetical protein BFP70_16875 [Thioclava sp. SK-1]|nr:hypothetical protein BFP70_16875 [Thioclava sp. SK-1]
MRGHRAYLSGAAAEAQVLRAYQAAGFMAVAQRWRGAGGEIDLILRKGTLLVFVEVKRAPTHAQAAERISAAQIARIGRAALAFTNGDPDADTRFDAALVDAHGQVEILENALMRDGM